MKTLLVSVITESKYMTVLPFGAAYIGAAARAAGHDVRMLSLNPARDDYLAILKNEIDGAPPDVIGLSMRNVDDQSMRDTVVMLEPVKRVVQTCHRVSEAPVVMGGPGYSIFPVSALEYAGADMGIRGEGEAAFVMLLDRLERGVDPSDVPGLHLPGKGRQREACFSRELDRIPLPEPHVDLAIPETRDDGPLWVPVQTRRGCPMGCSYCSTATLEGKRVRKLSPQRAVQQIKAYVDAGFHHFFFVDSNFNVPASYAEAICDGIISEKLKINGTCIIYPKRVRAGLVDKMARAGFRQLSLGFESGSETVLRNMNKRFSLDEVRRASSLFKDAGFFQMGFLLLGGPGETKETVIESLSFVDELDLDLMNISVGIRMYPDTPLAALALEEGRITARDDLLSPRFYVVEEIRDWIYETVESWAKDRPNWMF